MKSSKTVKGFLEEKMSLEKQQKDKELAELRYKVLSYYNLGEMVMFDGEGNEDDFPLGDEDARFKYVCNISDEDFEKVYAIYKNEAEEPAAEISKGAEGTLNACAIIILIIGVISLIAFGIIAYDDDYYHTVFHWNIFGIGLGVFFVSLINFAFARVIANISNKLNNLKK